MASNAFTKRSALQTEADVEACFIDRLLARLQYPDHAIRRKRSLDRHAVPRGHRKETYRPDYVLLDRRGCPAVVIEAKAPDQRPEAFHYQVSGYALAINQEHHQDNPIRYVVVTNGLQLLLWPWDSSNAILDLSFHDFTEDTQAFIHLRSLLAFGALDVTRAADVAGFKFVRPNLNDLIRTFYDCHQQIWKKDKLAPAEAFYEFSKLIFVKLREDKKIVDRIEDDDIPDPTDFRFSGDWIRRQVDSGITNNPVGSLFDQIKEGLEEKISTGEKKRIFGKDEQLGLRTETIEEVVDRLQHTNLHGIDEDLNGRMFETFLNATVRGKDLGQFFTPRSVVKYMTRTAPLQLCRQRRLPIVLDGCCGSGGFLIEAMAVLSLAIDERSELTNAQRKKLKKQLHRNHLFGIEAAEKIARIARLNMYLHGDGGSTIYTADTLDKDLRISSGLHKEVQKEKRELRKIIKEDQRAFDVVLTNPPFSMRYSRKTPDEKEILDQYEIAIKDGKATPSEKSNVLFIERYHDLMAPGSELLTVIDDTVLNGSSAQRYRDYILKRFIIRQVISLPFNTFYTAQAGVKTSILHLRKKRKHEQQGHVFMAILNNVGHDDHQRYTPERDNTKRLLTFYNEWISSGERIEHFEENEDPEESLGCPFQAFVVQPDQLCSRRLDAFYYSLDLRRTLETMKENERQGKIRLGAGRDFSVVKQLTRNEKLAMAGKTYRYFDIGDVTKDGEIMRWRTDFFEKLPTRARLRVRANDVVFARNISSRGTAVIIPEDFDGCLVTTGFLAVRPEKRDDALLLWAAFTSEAFRRQIYYWAVTAVQPEVRAETFCNSMVIPLPEGQYRDEMLAKAGSVLSLQRKKRNAVKSVRETANTVFFG